MQGICPACTTRSALGAAAAGEEEVQEGCSRKGSASTPHHICPQLLKGTAVVWSCLPHGLRWLSAEPNSAFQGQQLDEMLGTDAKSVYCVYYVAALGVTYLNPCAAQQGNAPHARLLVLSNPLSSLLRIQHVAVAAAPWKKRDMHQSHVELISTWGQAM